MHLSEQIRGVLKNFSTINDSIIVEEGNLVRTMSLSEDIYAEALVDSVFPRTCGFYELNSLLRALQMFNSPSLSFDNEDYLLISELEPTDGNRMTAKYYYCEMNILQKAVKLPSGNMNLMTKKLDDSIDFVLQSDVLKKIKDACNVYGLNRISFLGRDNKLYLVVGDSLNPQSNTFSIEIVDESLNFENDFNVVLNSERLKIMDTSYNVFLNDSHIIFRSFDNNICYLMALEAGD